MKRFRIRITIKKFERIELNRDRQLVKANAEQQPPPALANMVVMVSLVVMDVFAKAFQSEGHGLDEGVETQT